MRAFGKMVLLSLVSMACRSDAYSNSIPTTAAPNDPPATAISCQFYPAKGISHELTVPVSFHQERTNGEIKTVNVGGFTVTLMSFGGDGGEFGGATLELTKDGALVHKTLWQVGDSMASSGTSTGLNYVIGHDNYPGGAELQYRCTAA